MKRLVVPLIAGAIVASMLLGSATIASASSARRPAPLNAATMSHNYMNSAMLGYTHMSAADFGSARADGWSCWSIVASSGVAPSSIVDTATRRAQTVVTGRVRHHWMSRSAASAFMRTFRADCWKYLGTAQVPLSASTPPTGTLEPTGTAETTGTPEYGYGCSGPLSPSFPPTTTPCIQPTATPSVPTTAAPSYGWGPGMCW